MIRKVLLSCSLVVKVVSIEMKGLGFESHWVELFPTSQIFNGFKSSPSVNEKAAVVYARMHFVCYPLQSIYITTARIPNHELKSVSL